MAKKKNTTSFDEIAMQEVKPGMVVRLHQSIKDVNAKGEEKERIQVFEGLVIRRRGGNDTGATITVRKVSEGVGVEKIFPLALPSIKKVEVVKQYKVRRANLGFLRSQKKRLKEIQKTV
jgi:large subunit ribosomal protein L19